MTNHSIVVLGGPDSGKTNYLARLWLALRARKFALVAPRIPSNIKYVEGAAQHILQGVFAPRSDRNVEEAERFDIPVKQAAFPDGPSIDVSVPDVSGELWKGAVERGDIASDWMDTMKRSEGALLFLRVLSNQNVAPLDWVTAAKLLSFMGPAEIAEGMEKEEPKIPTQVALCEMLRFLDEALHRHDKGIPRVAVIITAWDLLDAETKKLGPFGFLKKEYPLFAGRVADCETLSIKCYGMSIVGGDFSEPNFKADFFDSDLDKTGYVISEQEGVSTQQADVTLPVLWVVEPLFTNG